MGDLDDYTRLEKVGEGKTFFLFFSSRLFIFTFLENVA